MTSGRGSGHPKRLSSSHFIQTLTAGTEKPEFTDRAPSRHSELMTWGRRTAHYSQWNRNLTLIYQDLRCSNSRSFEKSALKLTFYKAQNRISFSKFEVSLYIRETTTKKSILGNGANYRTWTKKCLYLRRASLTMSHFLSIIRYVLI